MPDSTSTRPLLRGKTITIGPLNEYKELLVIESDAQTDLLVGHIRVDINDATTLPFINVYLNGKTYLKDFPLLNSYYTFDFGRHILMSRVDKPFRIEVKATAAGLGSLITSAYVDGLEIPC